MIFFLLDGREPPRPDETLGLSPGDVQRICDPPLRVALERRILASAQQGGELRMRSSMRWQASRRIRNVNPTSGPLLADSDWRTPGGAGRWKTPVPARSCRELLADAGCAVDMASPFCSQQTSTTLQSSPLCPGEL